MLVLTCLNEKCHQAGQCCRRSQPHAEVKLPLPLPSWLLPLHCRKAAAAKLLPQSGLHNTARFGTVYGGNDTKDKLWLTGASKAKLTETPLSCLLALPTFIAEFLGKQGGARLPHKLQKLCLTTSTGGNGRSCQTNGNLY